MSKTQRDEANKFMRGKLGNEVDAAAGAVGFRVKEGGEQGEEAPDGRVWLELPGLDRPLSDFGRELGNVLAGEDIFLRENYPVTVTKKGAVEVISSDDFRTLIERWSVPYKLQQVKVARGETGWDKIPATMTAECAKGTLAARPFKERLRELERVNTVPMPIFRADGSCVLLPEGYDEESKTFTLESGVKINDTMKPEEGQAIVRHYLKDFPIPDPRSLSVAVAAMVAAYSFHLQELTASRMSFVYRSNVEGAGKSLLAQCALTPAFGLTRSAPLSNEDELRKLLDATALAGLPYIFLDNMTGHVASKLIDAYLTTPIWGGRLLGTSKVFEAPANAMLFVTGNGITLSPDIARRSLVCNLHVENADPNERQPEKVMTPQYLARPAIRGDLLSALWSMIRGWHQAGMPAAPTRIRTFEEWSDIIGGIVAWNGFGNPLEKPKDEESPNTEEVDRRGLMEALSKEFGEARKMVEFTFHEIVDVCRKGDLFDWMINGRMVKKREKCDDGSYEETEHFEPDRETSAKFGKFLNSKMGGQIYRLKDGRRLRFGKRGNGRHKRFQVEIVPEVAPTVVVNK